MLPGKTVTEITAYSDEFGYSRYEIRLQDNGLYQFVLLGGYVKPISTQDNLTAVKLLSLLATELKL